MSKLHGFVGVKRTELNKIEKDIMKQIRARNRRVTRKALRVLKEAIINNTPVNTGATRKAWKSWENIEKDGVSTKGRVFIDRNFSRFVFKSKRGKFKFSKGQKEGWVKVQPYLYIWKVENKKKFAKNAAVTAEAKIIQTLKEG